MQWRCNQSYARDFKAIQTTMRVLLLVAFVIFMLKSWMVILEGIYLNKKYWTTDYDNRNNSSLLDIMIYQWWKYAAWSFNLVSYNNHKIGKAF